MHEFLALRSAAQGGVFTRADALSCGCDDAALRHLMRSGACRRIARGVYAVPTPDLDAEDRHRLLTRGLLRRMSGDAAASHHSALVLHGLPVYGVDLRRVHLVGGSPRKVRRLPQVTVHRPVPTSWLTTVDGMPCVEVATALVQHATRHDTVSSVVSADAALNRRLLTVDELEQAVSLVTGRPGSRTAAAMVRLVDPLSESVGETRLRFVLRALGISVESQFKVKVGGEVIARSDFKVIGVPVLIEFDGMVKYAGRDGAANLGAEKLREDSVRDEEYEVVRIVWADLGRPQVIRRKVNSATERARRRGLC